ncbi:MAG: Dipeptide transport system permease protein DppB [uncultured Thermomicrobiales bacterium]|uniref:Dipeptide transport system permease protein DppB n=1 Tax=uncultured Thermomicrobiales bacterium TaxID=1645740 RepID=A0A6J4UIV6_9BACT|nr:MAG: Dipeptide transport system permease protein DppB [uncultured Thermomicrobiales bacterium]
MVTIIGRRVMQAIPVLLGISVFTFLMLHLVPGDPVTAIAGDKPLSDERIAQIRHQYGLDRPLWVQYGDYMGGVLRGDLGSGLHSQRPVADSIREALWPTVQLTLAGLVVAVSLGVALGILAAMFHNSWVDSSAMALALLGVSMPVFYLGLLLLFAFSFHFHLFPATGLGGWQHLVLPAVAVGFASSAYVARLVRSSMLEVLRQDYIVTARAKGLVERFVVSRHALKNALIPTITYLGLQLAGLLSGAVVTETVFSRPGLGRVAVSAISNRDYPLIQGTVLVTAGIYVLVNLVVDLLYGIIDPRIRYD